MTLYPSCRTNLSFFSLIIALVGGYFFWQMQHASDEIQKHAQDHSEILAAVVAVNIENTLLSQSGLEDTVAASLENSARFIHYLNQVEAFSSAELTAFAVESGFEGVKIVHVNNVEAVSGPAGWLPGRMCRDVAGLERIENEQLYLFSYIPAVETTERESEYCVLVGLSSEEIDATLEKISVERLLSMFQNLYDIAYVRFRNDSVEQGALPDNILETVISMGDKNLVVALKTDRYGKRRMQMRKEFIIFTSFLILFGALSSWLLYRIQRQRLQQARKFERRLARQHEDAALGRAAATITHELRNPLNAIGMGLQRLQIEAANLDQDHNKLLQSMRSAVDRSNTIITRLKDSIHAYEITTEKVDIVALANQAITLYRGYCDAQQIDVEFKYDSKILALGDKTLLEQLFENLVKNSVEAQVNGGFLKIDIALSEKKGMCQIELTNGGFTLNREESKLLFEPYFTSKNKGTGLGLVISRKIVQAHGGQLSWNADYAMNTIRFIITLPVS